jgi:2-oxoglutarate ferredoxin oxidoreductase subunit gamma
MRDERILCAGFGGQGIMSLGQLLAYAGMLEGKYVTWIPSYGPEMRGGTAFCNVVISDHEIGSPIVTGNASCAIIMNLPSLRKFEHAVIPGGSMLVNSSMVKERTLRKDINDFSIPAGELARECGNPKASNMVMLGSYLALAAPVSVDSVIEIFCKVFGKKSARLTRLNCAAMEKGAETIFALQAREQAA